jgi:hypothetical protein
MDGNFTIRPRPGVQKAYTPRDPVPVRETVETELAADKAAAAAGDGGAPQRDPRQGSRQDSRQESRHDPAPHDVVADPESRQVILRENDVRTHANEPTHPDQALLRLRAYRPAPAETEPRAETEPHANIQA